MSQNKWISDESNNKETASRDLSPWLKARLQKRILSSARPILSTRVSGELALTKSQALSENTVWFTSQMLDRWKIKGSNTESNLPLFRAINSTSARAEFDMSGLPKLDLKWYHNQFLQPTRRIMGMGSANYSQELPRSRPITNQRSSATTSSYASKVSIPLTEKVNKSPSDHKDLKTDQIDNILPKIIPMQKVKADIEYQRPLNEESTPVNKPNLVQPVTNNHIPDKKVNQPVTNEKSTSRSSLLDDKKADKGKVNKQRLITTKHSAKSAGKPLSLNHKASSTGTFDRFSKHISKKNGGKVSDHRSEVSIKKADSILKSPAYVETSSSSDYKKLTPQLLKHPEKEQSQSIEGILTLENTFEKPVLMKSKIDNNNIENKTGISLSTEDTLPKVSKIPQVLTSHRKTSSVELTSEEKSNSGSPQSVSSQSNETTAIRNSGSGYPGVNKIYRSPDTESEIKQSVEQAKSEFKENGVSVELSIQRQNKQLEPIIALSLNNDRTTIHSTESGYTGVNKIYSESDTGSDIKSGLEQAKTKVKEGDSKIGQAVDHHNKQFGLITAHSPIKDIAAIQSSNSGYSEVNKVYRQVDMGSDNQPSFEQAKFEVKNSDNIIGKSIEQKSKLVETGMGFEAKVDKSGEKVGYKPVINEKTQASGPVIPNRGLYNKVSEVKSDGKNNNFPTSIDRNNYDGLQVSTNNKSTGSGTLPNRVSMSRNLITNGNPESVISPKALVNTGNSDLYRNKVNVVDESLPKIELPIQRSLKGALPITISNNSESSGLLAERKIGNIKRDTQARPLPLDMPMAGSGLVKADRIVQSDRGDNRMTSGFRSQSSSTGKQANLFGKDLHRFPASSQGSHPTLSKEPAAPVESPQNESNGSKPDLRELARELYPFLKRMIIVDRERMSK